MLKDRGRSVHGLISGKPARTARPEEAAGGPARSGAGICCSPSGFQANFWRQVIALADPPQALVLADRLIHHFDFLVGGARQRAPVRRISPTTDSAALEALPCNSSAVERPQGGGLLVLNRKSLFSHAEGTSLSLGRIRRPLPELRALLAG